MKLTKILPLALLTVGLTSCLDDEPITGRTEDAQNIIEFLETPTAPATEGYILPVYNRIFDVVPSTTFEVTVNYAGTSVAPEDIEVGIVVDEAALDAYNEKIIADERAHLIEIGEDPEDAEAHVAGELFDLIPAELYEVPSSVTIKKGERQATFEVTVRPELFDFAYKYGLPLTLTADEKYNVSGNFGSGIFQLGAKNKYHANYSVTATSPMVDKVNAALVGYYPLDSDLITTGARSVVMYSWTYLGGYEGHPIKNGTAGSYYGSFAPVFHMDEAGNVIDVTNYYGQPAGNGRAAKLNPEGVNKWTFDAEGNPESLEVSYIMVQAGADRTFFHEKWTFEGEAKK
ncbi:DUF1735 domain-containing protein [Pontibacter sp. KCTC 32443]|uniref:DUF1735 domain-containing protein n=1 Tax=Pontibacter TaxID=323449 RepID=UPI00164EAFE2|nr:MULTISPECIES: DUF1735 domain-containing protein [Pontibacter]MBC5775977.1 DUF1735 domain-containing protein [Pontibacter sp. KCTC 32443]